MEAVAYGAEKVSTPKRRQFQVRLNRARQAATTWSDADRQKAIEQLERRNPSNDTAKRKLFDKLFQRHERQLLQEVGTKATGPRSNFAKELALKKTAAEDEAYGAANMTATSDCNFGSAYPMLRQKPRPGAWLIRSVSLTSGERDLCHHLE